ncbi:MAG: bifunctional phosphoribosylaminoimidazolecarboxamide formyltransferase/IMP cyclohydrolase [Bacteroidota bacterium]
MTQSVNIKSALISVYYKDNLEPIIRKLNECGVRLISTGGTYDFISSLGIVCEKVETLTGFPAILGGRVKTLDPHVFGGILARRDNEVDWVELAQHKIDTIDLVIIDLYPFEETLLKTDDESEIIEKIDIGGISLIRAAAKNFKDVLVCASRNDYPVLLEILTNKKCSSEISDRQLFASKAFAVTSNYDTSIFNYFNSSAQLPVFKKSIHQSRVLRYGENPHQQGIFYGNLDELLEQFHGKELSYNNLVDVHAAMELIKEFEAPTFAVIKHTNSCGVASDENLSEAWKKALAGDPVSAFGGVIIANRKIDEATAKLVNELFLEILIAPDYDSSALEILKSKKNRIILQQKKNLPEGKQFKNILNGVIEQDEDLKTDVAAEFKIATVKSPEKNQIADLEFASKVCKHLKSNTITLVRNQQLLSMGCGQTSRVDALKQAIEKAKNFGFDLKNSVMASDAFFPFPDCVQIAGEAGVTAVIQPGGSIKDKDSIDYCNQHNMAMVLTGTRHFKH